MDEEQYNAEQYAEQVEGQEGQEESRAGRIAGSIGSLLGGAARGVGSAFVLPSQAIQPAEPEDELADLFEVPQPGDNDIFCDDLLELDEEDIFGGPEDMSDLLSVSREDVIYGADKPKPKFKLIRTNKPYYPELTGLR